MKFILALTLLITLLTNGSFAQRLHLNAAVGATNYSGDLQVKEYTFNQANPAFALGLSYELSEKFLIRTQFMLGKLTAHDKYNPLTAMRNLNFTSTLSEGQVVAEYYLRDLTEYAISPYLFAGIAAFHFNPYTFDSTGNKYFLQPLSTEGQGFFEDRKPYKLTQFAIPFGGGVKLALSENIRVGVEMGMRKLFTDYLDDVSMTYVDPNILVANKGNKTLELAYRGSEVKNPTGYLTGENRGNAKNKDWYYFTCVTTSVRIGGANEGGRRGGKSKLGCPTRL